MAAAFLRGLLDSDVADINDTGRNAFLGHRLSELHPS